MKVSEITKMVDLAETGTKKKVKNQENLFTASAI